jgi:non-homologous end joining protein Ku
MAETEEPKAQVIDLMEALKASLASPRPSARSASAPKTSKMPIKAEAKRKPAKPAARKAAAAKSRAR